MMLQPIVVAVFHGVHIAFFQLRIMVMVRVSCWD